jgi:glycosyltransferase involved in cell wall biosynthesis
MHLGLYEEVLHTEGRTFDTYGPFAREVSALSRQFDRVTVFAPTTDQPTYFSGQPIDAPNVRVAPLPFFMTHAGALRHAFAIRRIFREHAGDLDVILARNTAPLAYLLWRMTRRRGAAFIYHFASDPFEMIARSPKYHGLRRGFARAAYGVEFAIQKHIMRRSYSFAAGQALYERLRLVTPNVEPIIESTLIDADYHERADSCTASPIRILYVGYLRHGKGLDDLLAAARLLLARGIDVEVDLVGEGEQRAPLTDQAARLGLTDVVHFRGRAVMGPPLSEHYNRADVFVLPSLSEGSPRVVLEAMGHSLPVVATPVGNVADLLGGGRRGVLVRPSDPASLAGGIERIVRDGEFRRQAIREGYAFARLHNLDTFARKVADRAAAMLRERAQRA